ncbi:MAG: hypothetical protein M1837_003722 [Sclerophora amabilis]|nr:MAG: hypothetical protein M1837_003722 [Sclerophora amabilis]
MDEEREDSVLPSSPDPITNSPTTVAPQSVVKSPQRWNGNRAAAKNGSDRTLQLQDFVLHTPPAGKKTFNSSPTKSTTQAENLLSPWRIRVTVEAEREDENQNTGIASTISKDKKNLSSSPTKQRRSSAIRSARKKPAQSTINVPLNDLESSPPPPARKRGRPRKSDQLPAKENSNSAGNSRGRRRTTAKGGIENEIEHDRQPAPVSKGSRRKPERNVTSDEPNDSRNNELEDQTESDHARGLSPLQLPIRTIEAARKRSKGRRKAMSPFKISADPDIDTADTTQLVEESVLDEEEKGLFLLNVHPNQAPSLAKSAEKEQTQSEVGQVDGDMSEQIPARKSDFNPRKDNTLKNRGRSSLSISPCAQRDNGSAPFECSSTQFRSRTGQETFESDRDHSISSLRLGRTSADQYEHDPPELDSIIESEGFSMVSISSIPGTRQQPDDAASYGNDERDRRDGRKPRELPSNEDFLSSHASAVRENESKQQAGKHTPTSTSVTGSVQSGSVEDVGSGDRPTLGSALTEVDVAKDHIGQATEVDALEPAVIIAEPDTPSPEFCKSANPDSRQSPTKPDYPEPQPQDPPSERANEDQNSSLLTNIKSSPPARILTYPLPSKRSMLQTPSVESSSPSLPPLLIQTNFERISGISPRDNKNEESDQREKTPRLAHVVKAGIALQGEMENTSQLGSPFRSPLKGKHKLQAQREGALEDLFGGFGQGTQRELRAGLKFGEELARRQHESAQDGRVNKSTTRDDDDVFAGSHQRQIEYPVLRTSAEKGEYALKLPLLEQVDYPRLEPNGAEQLLSPASTQIKQEDDAMDWQKDTPVKVFSSGSVSSSEADQRYEGQGQVAGNDTVFSTYEEREARWQREREAVSKEIEAANSSQVVVIEDPTIVSEERFAATGDDDHPGRTVYGKGSDDQSHSKLSSHEEQGNEQQFYQDVWQSETQPSDPLIPRLQPINEDPLANKPPRGKIPSPWRRNDKSIIYSDELEQDEEERDASRQLEREQQEKRLDRQRAKEEKQRRRTRESWLDLSVLLGLKPSAESANETVPNSDEITLAEGAESFSSPLPASVTPQELPSSPGRVVDTTLVSVAESSPTPSYPSDAVHQAKISISPAESLATTGEWRKCHWKFLSDLYWATDPSTRGRLLPKGHALPVNVSSKTSNLARPLAPKSTNTSCNPAPTTSKPNTFFPTFITNSLFPLPFISSSKEEPKAAQAAQLESATKGSSSLLGRHITNITGRNLILGPTEMDVVHRFREKILATNMQSAAAIRENVISFSAKKDPKNREGERTGKVWDTENPLYVWSETYVARRLFSVVIAAKMREEKRQAGVAAKEKTSAGIENTGDNGRQDGIELNVERRSMVVV